MGITRTVEFAIPNNILTGLTNGSYERIGGVIRNRQSKHIVTWLQETGNSADTLGQLPNAAMLVNSALGASQLINLSLTAVTIAAMEHYANRISGEIEKLSRQIDMQFDINRMSKLKTALTTATNNSSDHQIRMKRVSDAASDLYESYQSFIRLAAAQIDSNPIMAQHYLQYALTAIISNVRCNLELDDMKSAKKNLEEAITYNNSFVPTLIACLLGKHPAIYFDEDMPREDVARLLRIQQWRLRHTTSDENEEATEATSEFDEIITILDDLRGDFWNNSILPKKTPALLNRLPNIRNRQSDSELKENPLQRYQEALHYAEITIENFQRLQGMDYELKLMRLSAKNSALNRPADPEQEARSPFATWQNDLTAENPNEYPLTVFIPDEPITLEQLHSVN